MHDLLINPIGSKAVNELGIRTSKHQQGAVLSAIQLLTSLQNGHAVLLLLVAIVSSLVLLKLKCTQRQHLPVLYR